MGKHGKGNDEAWTSQDKPAGSPLNSVPFNQNDTPQQKADDFDRQHADHESSKDGRKGQ
jgi:hypothetical protein